MPSNKVAIADDLGTVLSQQAPSGFQTGGTWSAVQKEGSLKSYAKLTVGTKPVIYEVTYTFTYTGKLLNGTASSTSEEVTLSAAGTKLQKSEQAVLHVGDSKSSVPLGNTVLINKPARAKLGTG